MSTTVMTSPSSSPALSPQGLFINDSIAVMEAGPTYSLTKASSSLLSSSPSPSSPSDTLQSNSYASVMEAGHHFSTAAPEEERGIFMASCVKESKVTQSEKQKDKVEQKGYGDRSLNIRNQDEENANPQYTSSSTTTTYTKNKTPEKQKHLKNQKEKSPRLFSRLRLRRSGSNKKLSAYKSQRSEEAISSTTAKPGTNALSPSLPKLRMRPSSLLSSSKKEDKRHLLSNQEEEEDEPFDHHFPLLSSSSCSSSSSLSSLLNKDNENVNSKNSSSKSSSSIHLPSKRSFYLKSSPTQSSPKEKCHRGSSPQRECALPQKRTTASDSSEINLMDSPTKTLAPSNKEDTFQSAPLTPTLPYSSHNEALQQQHLYLQTPPSRSPVPIVVSSKKLGNDIRVQHQKKSSSRRRVVGSMDDGVECINGSVNEGSGADVQVRMMEMDLSTNASSPSPSKSVLFDMMDDDDNDHRQHQKKNKKKNKDIDTEVEILGIDKKENIDSNGCEDVKDSCVSLFSNNGKNDSHSPASSLSSRSNNYYDDDSDDDDDEDEDDDDGSDYTDDDDDDDCSSGSSTVIHLPPMPRPPPSATRDEQAKFYWELCYGTKSPSGVPAGIDGTKGTWSAARQPPIKSCLSSKKRARSCVQPSSSTSSSLGNHLYSRSTPTLCDRFQFNDVADTENNCKTGEKGVQFYHPSPMVNDGNNSLFSSSADEMMNLIYTDGEVCNEAKTGIIASTPKAFNGQPAKKEQETITPNMEDDDSVGREKLNVKFGSPSVAEFEEDRPTVELTPLPSEFARQRFPVEEVEEPEQNVEMHQETVRNAALLAEWESDFDSFLEDDDEGSDNDGSDDEGMNQGGFNFAIGEDADFDVDRDSMDLGSPNVSRKNKRRKKRASSRRMSRGDRRSSSFFSKGGKSLLEESDPDDDSCVGGGEHSSHQRHRHTLPSSSESSPRRLSNQTMHMSPSLGSSSANTDSSSLQYNISGREESNDLLINLQSSGGAISTSFPLSDYGDKCMPYRKEKDPSEEELKPSHLDVYFEQHCKSYDKRTVRASEDGYFLQSDGTWEEV
uniref:Uncharacterized protein n=1 Tax=Ditylum brightwellii TaxID=49249 RepID=A0A6U3ZNC4_9STRA|mmetsp:Transcript_33712/g.50301  ORF Transcript_33712/g.50301 Transcript_33712/m.50301 type:complete len:1059 (+) Transcript_33712:112-3288(+)